MLIIDRPMPANDLESSDQTTYVTEGKLFLNICHSMNGIYVSDFSS